jgi:hypothetical protein
LEIKNLTLEQLLQIKEDIEKEIAQTKKRVEMDKCGYLKEENLKWGISFCFDDFVKVMDSLEIGFIKWFARTKISPPINLDKYNMIYQISITNIKDEAVDLFLYGFFDVDPIVASTSVAFPAIQLSQKGREYLIEEYAQYNFK